MKNIFSFLSRESIEESFRLLGKRFLLPTLIVIYVTSIWLYIVNAEKDDMLYARLIFTGIVTFFLSIGVCLFLETRKTKKYDSIIQLLPILYGVFFYFTVDIREDMEVQSVTYFLLHLAGFFSFVFFAPYLIRILEGEEGSIEYTNYFARVTWTLLMSVIVGVSLLILGFIAIFAVTSLFDVFSALTESKLYGNWAALALSLIAPLYGLVQMPQASSVDARSYETNRFFSFLIRYVAVPFIYIYFTILYAYSLKVLANFSDWPKGIVSWLVIGFSSFGYLTYIFSKAYESGSIVALFRRYFPYVVIPQIGMLGYAIYLRIAQYDLTMNRYFVVIFGLWLFVISLYYIVSKRKSLSIIVASLSLIALVISLGPWSVFSYPLSRQEARLIRHLEQANILQSGKIIPLTSERDISKDLSTEIAGGIEYLCSFDDCTRVKSIFPEQAARAEVEARTEWEKWNKDNTGSTYHGASYWQIQSTITRELKVQKYPFDNESREFPEPQYLSYNTDYQKGQYPLQVAGYDRVVQVMGDIDEKYLGTERTYPYLSIGTGATKAYYHTASGVIRTYTLTLPEKLTDSATLSPVTQEDLTFVVSDEKYEIRILLQSLTVANPRYVPPTDTSPKTPAYAGGSNGLALVKENK